MVGIILKYAPIKFEYLNFEDYISYDFLNFSISEESNKNQNCYQIFKI